MNPMPFQAHALRPMPLPVRPTVAVEVTPLPVRVMLADGETLHVLVFLHTSSDRRLGPQSLGERLRDANTFFLPCVVGRGVELVNLEHVVWVQVPRDLPGVADELAELPSLDAKVDLDLLHGERLSGELRYSLPPGHCRISDLFNSETERFVLLTTDRHAIYVNRRAVVRVKMAGEDASCR